MTGLCRLCDKPTDVVFGINLNAVFVCGDCALSITKQEVAKWGIVTAGDYTVSIETLSDYIEETTELEL